MKLRRTVYFALLIVSVILISFFGGTVSYAFFFAMLLIPVLSYGYLLAVFAQFKIYQKIESRDVVSNTPMGYYFVLQNDGFTSFSSIQIRMFSSFSDIEELPLESEFCLVPGEEYRYETRIFCKYRGEYEVGIKEVVLTDFLRLFTFKYKIPSTIKALVVPCLIHMQEINSLDEVASMSAVENQMQNDSLDTIVREYIPGDSIRSINWKISAKEGQLMTRQNAGEKKQGICLLIDNKHYYKEMEKYLPLEDKMLKAMLAVSLYLVGQDIPLDVLNENYGTDVCRVGSMHQFNEFYAGISQFHFNEKSKLEDTLSGQEAKLSSYGVIILFVHNITEGELILIKRLSDRGTYVLIYVIGEETLETDYDILRQDSFRGKVISIPLSANLEEVLQ